MRKILISFGTRPEAIKMAPLVKSFRQFPELFDVKVCVTAQHREMLDQVLSLFDLNPEYDLNIMKQRQDLYDITSGVLLGMRSVLQSFSPDIVFVHGDTTTSMVVSLAAFYEKISVAHVEAGLRTYDIYSPYPEEMNRQLTGRIAAYHFAPTEKAASNLINEGVSSDKVWVTGNTVIDALFDVAHKIDNDKLLEQQIVSTITEKISCRGFSVEKDKFILITGHRRENFGLGFINICEALKSVAEKYPDVHLLYPVHLNPNVQKPVKDILGKVSNVHLIAPLRYEEFVYAMNKSYLIITDSGGVQEEAPSLGKPVLVMRDTTERPEAVTAGTVKLVGTDRDKIVKTVDELLGSEENYKAMSVANNPYGDGKACNRIVDITKKITTVNL